MKAVTIENKWLVTMLHSMYINNTTDPFKKNVKYRLLDENAMGENILSIFNYNGFSGAGKPLSHYKYFEDDYAYMNFQEEKSEEVLKCEETMIKKVLTFSSLEEKDCIMISPDFLDDKYTFLDNFDLISNKEFLTSEIM